MLTTFHLLIGVDLYEEVTPYKIGKVRGPLLHTSKEEDVFEHKSLDDY